MRAYGLTQPIRTADLLHVAMMEFGFDVFVTADFQQHHFALAAGYASVLLPQKAVHCLRSFRCRLLTTW